MAEKVLSVKEQLRKKAYWDYSACAICWNVYDGCEEKCGNATRVIKLKDVLSVLKQHQAELRKLTNDLQKERNNALQWVEETFGYGENEEALAQAVCNAIQVFMNRVVLKRLALQKKGDNTK